MIRQVVLDTETTGLSWEKGNRVVEIGCVEIIQRRKTGRTFQRYLNPERDMELGAQEVTGLSREFLSDKARFSEVVEEFLDFIRGAELIIHNASFDIGFLNYELSLAGTHFGRMSDHASVLDTLAMARERFPGQRNSLDALCKRLDVNNNHRALHGALLDAELLSEVYLSITAGQGDLGLSNNEMPAQRASISLNTLARVNNKVMMANDEEQALHLQRLEKIAKKSGGHLQWSS
jgi:DNA polymerase III subunit epsilon